MLDFLGIGAQKAGTTWIYENLKQHPKINFPLGKEVHFWNNYNEKNHEDYFGKFTDTDVLNGEITPAYSMLDVDVIKKIKEYNPNIKIFFIIRNPIDRAWSSALMALRKSEMKFSEASDQWFVDHFNSEGSLKRGGYYQILKNWLSVIKIENFKLLVFDDIVEQPENLISSLHSFLAIEDVGVSHPSRAYGGTGEALPERLRQVLLQLYDKELEFLKTRLQINFK